MLLPFLPGEGCCHCAAARSRGDTHRREPAAAFLFEFVAALQGLPLFPFLLSAAKGCHLLFQWHENRTGAAATPRRRAAGP